MLVDEPLTANWQWRRQPYDRMSKLNPV